MQYVLPPKTLIQILFGHAAKRKSITFCEKNCLCSAKSFVFAFKTRTKGYSEGKRTITAFDFFIMIVFGGVIYLARKRVVRSSAYICIYPQGVE